MPATAVASSQLHGPAETAAAPSARSVGRGSRWPDRAPTAAAGDQVASFTLDAINDSTATLNALFNAAGEGTQSQVDVYTVDLSGFLASFSDGMAIFSLVLQGPALGNGPGSTRVPKDFNGAGLDFASLELTPEIPVNDDVPEPATMGLFVIGLAGLGFEMRRRRAIR